MILYHGSNVGVRKPEIRPSERALDFGIGFYLTTSYQQAQKWSKLTVTRRNSGTPIVSVFSIEEQKMEQLSVLHFTQADGDWLKFISASRKNIYNPNPWDIIWGPVANDNTMPVINLYLQGYYDESEAIKRLLTQKLKDQLVFKTERALEFLTYSQGQLL